MGYSSTLDYVAAAAAAVLQETGLIPHINAGVMDQQQLQRWVLHSGALRHSGPVLMLVASLLFSAALCSPHSSHLA